MMKGIYRYLITPVIGVTLLLTICIAVFSIYGIHTRITPQMERMSTETLQARADQVSTWLESKIMEIEYLAYMIRDEDISNEEQLMGRISRFLDQTTHSFESMGYVTLDGIKHVTDGSTFDVTQRAYYRKILEEGTRTVISDSIASRANGEKIILIITELRDDRQKVVGYLSGAITLGYLEEIVIEAGLNGYPMYIVNGSDYGLIAGEYQEPNGTGQVQVLHSSIPSYPDWYLAVHIPHNVMASVVKEYVWGVMVFLLVSTVAGIFMLSYITRRMVRPIQLVQKQMENISDGVPEKAVCNTNIAEIRLLTDSYNGMVDNLTQLIERLRQEETQKIEAENKALYSQIKPHFLYNTLETIQSIAYDHNDEAVETAIGNLATLFRIGLSSGKQMISLCDELIHVKSYLEIQRLRYGHLFDYEIETPCIHENWQVLKFLLQPLVENAIYHGIKNSSRKGTILIRISETEEALYIEVENTYEDLNKEQIALVNEQLVNGQAPGDSYGLYNVNQRLRVNFRGNTGVRLSYNEQYVTAGFYHPRIAGGAG